MIMKTYKEFLNPSITIEHIDEGMIAGVAIERKLKTALQSIKSADDVGEKIDILMKALHFALGSMALELHTFRKGAK